MKRYWDMWFGGLFMQQSEFDEMVQERYAFAHGLNLVILVGLLAGVAGVARAALRYALSPSADAIKNTVLVHLQRMPWYTALENNTSFVTQFQAGYDRFWNVFGGALLPDPLSARVWAGILLTPLWLALGWLVYGLLVHLFARILHGEGNLGHALGALSLASAPQALTVLTLWPGLGLGAGLISLWTLVINYVAVRTAYRLSPGRAFWVTVLPLFLFFALLFVLVLFGGVALSALIQRGGLR